VGRVAEKRKRKGKRKEGTFLIGLTSGGTKYYIEGRGEKRETKNVRSRVHSPSIMASFHLSLGGGGGEGKWGERRKKEENEICFLSLPS